MTFTRRSSPRLLTLACTRGVRAAAFTALASASWACLPSAALEDGTGGAGGTGTADGSGGSAVAVPPVGCGLVDPSMPPPMAPGGYYTSGGTVCTGSGVPHLFHGVDRPSMEWQAAGDGISLADFQLIAGWGANVVRIALNQDFWLEGAALQDPGYRPTVQQAVAWAESAGLDVILDLHWSDCGNLAVATTKSQGCGNSNQQRMADPNSLTFWREVADLFKGDGHVLFELYNEPHDVSSDVWLHGGLVGNATYVGMQQLYDAVRAEGADNVVVVGGLQWAYNLGFVGPAQHVQGYNVMYATHPYLTSGDLPAGWESNFGHLETTDFAPVIATEFGDGSPSCTGAWDQQLIDFCDAHHASWTAWAWYPSDCHFPALISDWAGTPTLQGAVVKQYLGNYPKSPGGTAAVDAGLDAGPGMGVDEAGSDAGVGAGPDAATGSQAGDDAGPPAADATLGDGSDAEDAGSEAGPGQAAETGADEAAPSEAGPGQAAETGADEAAPGEDAGAGADDAAHD